MNVDQKLLTKKLQKALEQAQKARQAGLDKHAKAEEVFSAAEEAQKKKDILGALELYKSGLDVAAGDDGLTAKFSDALKALEKDVNELVARLRGEADAATAVSELEKAVALLLQAVALTPNDKKLALALKKAQLAKSRENLPQFNSLVKAGDEAILQQRFDDALGSFKEAATLVEFPGDDMDKTTQERIERVGKAGVAFLFEQIVSAEQQFSSGAILDATVVYTAVRTNSFLNDTVSAALSKKQAEAEAKFDEFFTAEEYTPALHVQEMVNALSPSPAAFNEKVQEMTKDMRPLGDAAFKTNRFAVAVGAYKLGLLYNKADKKLTLALKKVEKKQLEEDTVDVRKLRVEYKRAVKLYEANDLPAVKTFANRRARTTLHFLAP